MDLDENGWTTRAVAPLPIEQAWTLLSPEPDARMDGARWAHQARTFFRAELALAGEKRYPTGAVPLSDEVEVDIAPAGVATFTRVLVVTLPLDRVPAARRAALAGVAAIGGAGFDVLVARGRRLWQVRVAVAAGGDARAPLAVTAVLASTLLAPVVPPEGGTIFGVKGARTRLEAAGWRT